MVRRSLSAITWCTLALCACGREHARPPAPPSTISNPLPPANPQTPPQACPGPGGEILLLDIAFDNIALDDTHIYLMGQDGSIWRVDKASHVPTQLAALWNRSPRVFALDDSHVFFTMPDDVWHGPGRLFELPKTGGEPQEVIATPTYIRELVIDDGDAFFRLGAPAGLVKLELTSRTTQVLVEDEIQGYAIDGELVVWVEGSVLYASDHSGQHRTEICDLPEDLGQGPLVEGEHIYWWDAELRLTRAIKSGGPAEIVMSAPDDFMDRDTARIVGEYMYWTTHGGRLWRSSIGPTPTPELLQTRGSYDRGDYPSLLAFDEQRVYWQAGPDLLHRTSDQDPLALYYFCR